MEYKFNDEAAKIGRELIKQFHSRLEGYQIAYLDQVKPVKLDKYGAIVKKKPKIHRAGKKEKWAKASLVTAKYAELLDKNYSFIIEIDQAIWDVLTDAQLAALIDHELCHCGADGDGPYMRSHDVEEFTEIIERHGLWKGDVKKFFDDLAKSIGVEINGPLPLFDQVEK